MGLFDTLNDVSKNRLFTQYLAAAGQDIGSGQPLGTNINKVTQQNISAQSYLKLLQAMLGGNVPEGGKLVVDSKGIKMDVPHEAVGKSSELDQGGINLELLKLINPFGGSQLGNISAADLAGLAPRDIATALAGATDIEALKEHRINTLLKYMERPEYAPLEVPGIGRVTLDEWKALDKETKAYAYYAFDAKRRGEQPLPYDEWRKENDSSTIMDIYKLSKQDPEFKKFIFEYKRAGAPRVSIGEKIKEAVGKKTEVTKAESKLAGLKYFSGDWSKDLDKYMSSDTMANRLIDLEGKERKREEIKQKAKWIEKKIISMGGDIQDVKMKGKIRVWTVKWPDGTTSEVKYAF